jgi:hypothetical protein
MIIVLMNSLILIFPIVHAQNLRNLP